MRVLTGFYTGTIGVLGGSRKVVDTAVITLIGVINTSEYEYHIDNSRYYVSPMNL